jgi:uncharacterized membrane protein
MHGPGAAAHRRWFMPPRFVLALVGIPLIALGFAALSFRHGQALLGGFDLAAIGFLASLWPLTRDSSPERMKQHAREYDAGRVGVLVITGLLMMVIFTAVAIELPDARKLEGVAKGLSLALVLASLVIAWLFSNVVYALHYAHMYYREDGEGGLNFPEMREPGEGVDKDGGEGRDRDCPDYWDFLYFSATMGMAFATSDVEICRSDMRRIALIHCILAFFYNLLVLAFTINVTAGS